MPTSRPRSKPSPTAIQSPISTGYCPRNQFAHNHRTSFSDQSIADRCRNLTFSAKDYGDVVLDAQGQLTTTAVALILNLTNRSHYVSQKRLKLGDWPY